MKSSREKTREQLQLAMPRVKNNGLRLGISAIATEAGMTDAGESELLVAQAQPPSMTCVDLADCSIQTNR